MVILDQEREVSLGGQAFWSLGGLFMVNTPEQRRWECATRSTWPCRTGSAAPSSTGPKTTGPGIVAPFERRIREHVAAGLIELRFRHRVDALVAQDGTVTGVSATVLEPSGIERGQPSSRAEIADFELAAQSVIVTSGGIGGNHDLVRQAWPERLGPAPRRMVAGVPAHVDGRMLGITAAGGGNVINSDRMWHYAEGLRNWDPIWANHGIRILPGLYAAGEVSGFGGGGMHGYNSLEGTFLGGCLFSGRTAGRSTAGNIA